MLSVLSSAPIKQKVIGGFAFVLITLLAVGGLALKGFSDTSGKVDEVVEQKQPVILAAERLDSVLNASVASLGFYMLSRDEQSKQDYDQSLINLKKALDKLKQLPLVQTDQEMNALVGRAQKLIGNYEAFHDRVVELATNDAKRIAAVDISSQLVNPLTQEFRQLLAQMIDSEMQEDAAPERKQILNDIHELRFAVANLQIALRGVVAFNDEGNYQNALNFGERTRAFMAKVQEHYDELTFEGQEAIDRMVEIYEPMNEGLEELFAVQKSEKAYMDIYVQRTEITPLVNEISVVLAELVEVSRTKIRQSSQDLASQVENTQGLVLVLVAVGVILGALIAAAVSWSILSPLNQVIDAMQDIAQGEGDLTRKLDERGGAELSALARYFNQFVDKIRETVSRTAEAVNHLDHVTGRLSQISEQTVQGADRQYAETERAATAMTEMASTSVEVADNARLAADGATDADGSAQDGQRVVSQTMDSINQLANEVARAADVIGSLQQDSLQIGGILDVIRGIAEQTNLLALNAAIEAARAGEQGRGFAVVADEVRTLASRTQDSTMEIQAMIERLQKSSEEAAEVMNNGRTLAEETVAQAGQTSHSLATITSAVNSISEMNASISTAAEEQSKVAEEINQNIVTISDISQQTARGSNEIAQATEEMTQLAQTLKSLVGAFRT
jgi:methyl-accepting chemotaxis protein